MRIILRRAHNLTSDWWRRNAEASSPNYFPFAIDMVLVIALGNRIIRMPMFRIGAAERSKLGLRPTLIRGRRDRSFLAFLGSILGRWAGFLNVW